MNRKLYLSLGAGLVFLIAFIILAATVLTQSEPTEQATSFCDEYPDAVFCLSSNYTTKDIAVDMVETFIDKYPSALDDTFCSYYFSGNLATYCIERSSLLVPSDFNMVRGDFDIVELEDNMFDIRTYYYSDQPAYTMRVALNDMDGSYHISGFSYFHTPATTDLELLDDTITSFMTNLITAVDDRDDDICTTYFTWVAKESCINENLTIDEMTDINLNPQIVKTGLNQYEYTVSNTDETEQITYQITFEDEDGATKISEIDYFIPEESATE